MTAQIIWVGLLGAALLILGGVVFFYVFWLFSRDDLSPRLERYVQEEIAKPGRITNPGLTIRTRDLSGSFASRVFLPMLRNIGGFFQRFTPTRTIESTRTMLIIAGNPMRMGVSEFLVVRLLSLFLGLLVFYLILRGVMPPINLLLGGLALFVCILLPTVWLRGRMRRRQNTIRKGLPDALDMLSVCADAGLGFDQSLQKVSEHWHTATSLEFGRVVAEMEMGLSRQEALRNLADRLDIPELSSFVAVIIQSDQLGMSISQTLHNQAEQMRVERRFRAQELARTVPIKMLIPLAFLIFPALIAVLLGPAIPSILALFGSL